MFASQALSVGAFFCCWGIGQEEDWSSLLLGEVLIRDDVEQCSVFMDDQAKHRSVFCALLIRGKKLWFQFSDCLPLKHCL